MGIMDIAVITLFICGLLMGVIFLLTDRGQTAKKEEARMTFDKLLSEVGDMLRRYGTGENKEQMFVADFVTEAVRECASGNEAPREVVKTIIFDWLVKDIVLEGEELDRVIAEAGIEGGFQSAVMIFERTDKYHGFKRFYKECLEQRAIRSKIILAEDIKGSLRFLKSKYGELNLREKQEVLTQLLYQKTVGLGAVDTLMWQKECIEEIQMGLSGYAEETYDYKAELYKMLGEKAPRVSYSRDSVHVLISGNLIKLDFISFETDEELIRVLRNLAGSGKTGELTKKNPRIVTETVDGRRVTVSRPPFSDSWIGLVRKFDTVTKTTIESLVEDKELQGILYEIIRNGKSIAVTGEMATGKTTLLRALLLEIGKEKSIRIVESESLELNIREFMPWANTLTLRVSKEHPAESVLEFTKKTTGQVFAVGEITSPWMAVMLTDISKTSGMVLFTAHYKKTEDMIADFTNARLSAGGYSDEQMAKAEALNALGIDIHLTRRDGRRMIEYVNEVLENGEIRCLWSLSSVA